MLLAATPTPNLQPIVRRYFHFEVSLNDSILDWPIPARSTTFLEFTFGEPYRIHQVDGSRVEITYPITLIGAKTYQRIRLELRRRVETFAIMFQPTGLFRLFSLPGAELLNEHYEANLVLGRDMELLRSRLGETRTFSERVAITDEVLSALLSTAAREHGIDPAIRAICCNQGCIRISELAKQAGLSLRQFERQFIAELGISPKLYARIVRFEAALAKKGASPHCDWTTVAHELSYHDQMHMIHDFQKLCGGSPKSLQGVEFLKAYVARLC